MSKIPMTSKQADEKYLCDICKKYGHGVCKFDCVLSSTCSFYCPSCNERVFFTGDLKYTPKKYVCPYCNRTQSNKYYHLLKKHRKY